MLCLQALVMNLTDRKIFKIQMRVIEQCPGEGSWAGDINKQALKRRHAVKRKIKVRDGGEVLNEEK